MIGRGIFLYHRAQHKQAQSYKSKQKVFSRGGFCPFSSPHSNDKVIFNRRNDAGEQTAEGIFKATLHGKFTR